MLRRFGSKWQNTVAILATILAIFLAPLPLPTPNTLSTSGHMSIVSDMDHDHLEQRSAGLHFVKGGVQHRHGHNSADHSHDLPTGISAAGAVMPAYRAAWAVALISGVVTNHPSSIERPPKASAIA